MDVNEIEREDELRATVELSVHNALLYAAHGNIEPIMELWRTALELDGSVKTCREKLLMELVMSYLR